MRSPGSKIALVSIVAIVFIGGAAYYTWQPRRFNAEAPPPPPEHDPLATVVGGQTYRQWLIDYKNDRVGRATAISLLQMYPSPADLIIRSFEDLDADVRLGGVMLFASWRANGGTIFSRSFLDCWHARVADPDKRIQDYVFEQTTDIDVLVGWLQHGDSNVRRMTVSRLRNTGWAEPYRPSIWRGCQSLFQHTDVDIRRGAVAVVESWIASNSNAVDPGTRADWERLVFDSDKRIRLQVIAHVERPGAADPLSQSSRQGHRHRSFESAENG